MATPRRPRQTDPIPLVEKRGPGRPTVLDEQRHRTIVKVFEQGGGVTTAARAAGVSRRALAYWLVNDGDSAIHPSWTRLRLDVLKARKRADRRARSGGRGALELGRDPQTAAQIAEALRQIEQRAARYRALIQRATEH